MTPEARLIAITDAMAAALARHGCHPSGSAIRSAWFAGISVAGYQEIIDKRKAEALNEGKNK